VNIVRPFIIPIQNSLFDIRCFQPSLPAFTRPVNPAKDFFHRLSNGLWRIFILLCPYLNDIMHNDLTIHLWRQIIAEMEEKNKINGTESRSCASYSLA